MKVFSTGFAIGLMEARVATPYPLAIGQVGLPALENSFALQKIFGATSLPGERSLIAGVASNIAEVSVSSPPPCLAERRDRPRTRFLPAGSTVRSL